MKSPTYGRISQGFWTLHKALDIVNALGTPIVAPVAGKVTHVGQMGKLTANAGIVVQIGNPTGDAHRLCHLNSAIVKVGQTVKEGQLVGYMGYTGFTIPKGIKGTHLHWIMFKGGVRVDPRKYVTVPATKPVVAPKPPTAIYHVVVKGNTMSAIAKKYGVTLATLDSLNPQIKNLNIISVGQKIRVK
jgi:murein DD-endopeptidase MepM/ murein hydrolase activator NlpD